MSEMETAGGGRLPRAGGKEVLPWDEWLERLRAKVKAHGAESLDAMERAHWQGLVTQATGDAEREDMTAQEWQRIMDKMRFGLTAWMSEVAYGDCEGALGVVGPLQPGALN